MSLSVQVLCPNGHRQSVKIGQNTKILQILEEVCVKQGFQPPEQYDLKQGRKTLDVTLTVRFAGLANHAKLELAKAIKPRAESNPVIALQLENGERIQHDFDPGTCLWDILLHFEKQPNKEQSGKLAAVSHEGHHPVCIYMREEIIGEYALKTASLRKLGLTGGKAIIRHCHRPVDANILSEIKDNLDKERERQRRLAAKAAEKKLSNESQNSFLQGATMQVTKVSVPMETDSSPNISGAVAMDVDPSSSVDRIHMDTVAARHRHFQQNNDLRNTGTDSMSSTDSTWSSARQNDGTAPRGGGGRQLGHSDGSETGIPGVKIYRPDQVHLSAEQEQVARSLAQHIMPRLAMGQSSNNPRPGPSREPRPSREPGPSREPVFIPPRPPLADFKFPEATKGKDVYKNELSEFKKEDFQPCDREAVLFDSEESSSNSNSEGQVEELPDNFFDVTETDLRSMMSDMKNKLDSMNEQMLTTSTMRQAQLEEKMDKYERAIIRFHFPDKKILQGTFRPRETVHSLHKFVKEQLENKNLEYYLYTTPPRQLLTDRAKTLFEANVAPLAVVHVGSKEEVERYLSSAVLKEMSTKFEADKIIAKNMYKDDSEGTSKDMENETSGQGQPAKPKRAAGKGGVEKGTVPKWFKVGKK